MEQLPRTAIKRGKADGRNWPLDWADIHAFVNVYCDHKKCAMGLLVFMSSGLIELLFQNIVNLNA